MNEAKRLRDDTDTMFQEKKKEVSLALKIG